MNVGELAEVLRLHDPSTPVVIEARGEGAWYELSGTLAPLPGGGALTGALCLAPGAEVTDGED